MFSLISGKSLSLLRDALLYNGGYFICLGIISLDVCMSGLTKEFLFIISLCNFIL